MGPSIEVVAIAKNESAYLAEWISHYLTLGVDRITVYLNGIEDHSYYIMRKISGKYPNVSYKVSDGYDVKKTFQCDRLISKSFLENNPMQSRVYAEGYIEASERGVDYVLFVDIDEYLTPRHGEASLSALVEAYGWPDFIRFKCFNAAGADQEFERAVRRELRGDQRPTSKCLVRTNLDNVEFRTTHSIYTPDRRKRYISGLGSVVDYTQEQVAESFDSDFALIHHWMRSETEYIATLLRGDFIFKSSLGLKGNRSGWRSSGKQLLTIEESVVDKFSVYCEKFVNDVGLDDSIDIAKELVRARAAQVGRMRDQLVADYQSLSSSLRGTSFSIK